MHNIIECVKAGSRGVAACQAVFLLFCSVSDTWGELNSIKLSGCL